MINLLLLNNFYSVISYQRAQKESDELLYKRFGHSLWSVNQLPAQGVKTILNLATKDIFEPF